MSLSFLSGRTYEDVLRILRKAQNMQAGPGLRLTKADGGYVLERVPVDEVEHTEPHQDDGDEDTTTKIFFTGGQLSAADRPRDHVQTFDTTTSSASIQDKGDLVRPSIEHAGAAISDKAYFVGGRNTGFATDLVQRLSFANNATSALDRGNMTRSVTLHGASASASDIYVAGGVGGSRFFGYDARELDLEAQGFQLSGTAIHSPMWQKMDQSSESWSVSDRVFNVGMQKVVISGTADKGYARGADYFHSNNDFSGSLPVQSELAVIKLRGTIAGSKSRWEIWGPENGVIKLKDPRDFGFVGESVFNSKLQKIEYSSDVVSSLGFQRINIEDQSAFTDVNNERTYFAGGQSTLRFQEDLISGNIRDFGPGGVSDFLGFPNFQGGRFFRAGLVKHIQMLDHATETDNLVDKGDMQRFRYRFAAGAGQNDAWMTGRSWLENVATLPEGDEVTDYNTEIGESNLEKFDFSTQTVSLEGEMVHTVELHAAASQS